MSIEGTYNVLGDYRTLFKNTWVQRWLNVSQKTIENAYLKYQIITYESSPRCSQF